MEHKYGDAKRMPKIDKIKKLAKEILGVKQSAASNASIGELGWTMTSKRAKERMILWYVKIKNETGKQLKR